MLRFFEPTRHALCFFSCSSQDQLSAPWRTAGPSFAASRHGSGLLLRSATSRVSLPCGNLGLRSSTAASFSAGRRTRHVPRLQPALPRRCPGAALNFLTGGSLQVLQVFFMYCSRLVRGLSPPLILTAEFNPEQFRPVPENRACPPARQSEFNTCTSHRFSTQSSQCVVWRQIR